MGKHCTPAGEMSSNNAVSVPVLYWSKVPTGDLHSSVSSILGSSLLVRAMNPYELDAAKAWVDDEHRPMRHHSNPRCFDYAKASSKEGNISFYVDQHVLLFSAIFKGAIYMILCVLTCVPRVISRQTSPLRGCFFHKKFTATAKSYRSTRSII